MKNLKKFSIVLLTVLMLTMLVLPKISLATEAETQNFTEIALKLAEELKEKIEENPGYYKDELVEKFADAHKNLVNFESTSEELTNEEKEELDALTEKLFNAMDELREDLYIRTSQQLNNAIIYAQEKIEKRRYTEDSKAYIRDAIIDGKIFLDPNYAELYYGKTLDELQVIAVDLTKAIYDAIDEVEEEIYSEKLQELKETVDVAEEIMEENYTEDSKAFLRDAMIDAKIFLEADPESEMYKDKTIEELQDIVERLTKKLYNALDSLEEGLFYRELVNNISTAEDLINELKPYYTENERKEAMDNLVKVLDEANEFFENEGSDDTLTKDERQDEINKMAEKLEEAILDVEVLEEEADLQMLTRAMNNAKEYIEQDDVYTKTSLNLLIQALDEAEDFYDTYVTVLDEGIFVAERYQARINELTDSVNEAIDNLEKIEDMEKYNENGLLKLDVLEGDKQTFNPNKDKGLTFRLDIDYDTFKQYGDVYIDDKRVEEDNYTSKSGSTIITLNDEFVKTLDEGEHKLAVPLAQGRLGEALATFSISEKAKTTNNPKTGDNIAVYSILFATAVMGMVFVLVKNRKY